MEQQFVDLLRQRIAALPTDTPANRQKIYDRAGQIVLQASQNADGTTDTDKLFRLRMALDDAIDILDAEYGLGRRSSGHSAGALYFRASSTAAVYQRYLPSWCSSFC